MMILSSNAWFMVRKPLIPFYIKVAIICWARSKYIEHLFDIIIIHLPSIETNLI